MKKATSAGGIIVKKEGDKYYLLLLYYSEYKDLGFLKGHVKEGETIEEDAIREMNEETGLQNISIINKIPPGGPRLRPGGLQDAQGSR